jgi:hypothetical protein
MVALMKMVSSLCMISSDGGADEDGFIALYDIF